MKRIIVLSIAILFASLLFVNETKAQDSKAKESQVTVLSEATFTKEIKSGVTLVDFYAEWCRPCKMMKPILGELATSHKDKIVIASINTDQNKTISREYNITSIPCMIVFKDGKEVKRIIGYHTKEQMEAELSDYLK